MYKFLGILLFANIFAFTTQEIYDESWALIIGIDKYQNVQTLDYAVKDAEEIQDMLVGKFQFHPDNIVLLRNEDATKDQIIQEFSNITNKAGENDRVLIFFAGHGQTELLPNGGEMGYLLPVDGTNDLYVSAIDMGQLKTLSLRSKAKHMLYLVDACYGGISGIGARSLDAQKTPNYVQKITEAKSRQIISAGGRGEEVIEKAEWGHSAFTKNLLSGLGKSKADADQDGVITAQELGAYLKKNVTLDSDSRQTPQSRRFTTEEGEFVFIYSDNMTINQYIGEKSTSEKLDLLRADIAELKSQKDSSYKNLEFEIPEIRMQKNDAGDIKVNFGKVKIPDKDGSITGFIGSATDLVSDVKSWWQALKTIFNIILISIGLLVLGIILKRNHKKIMAFLTKKG